MDNKYQSSCLAEDANNLQNKIQVACQKITITISHLFIMFSINNYSKFPITSLPPEVIKMILQKVDWKTIYNLRLVSKYFNSFILTNLDTLPKPIMTSLSISSS